MKPVATIILNRNLPNITDKLYNHLRRFDGNETDIFVVDSGSDKKKLSKYTTWHANCKSAVSKGLRYYRGMNYGLKKLHQEKKFLNYEAFFLISNDAVLRKKKTIKPMLSILRRNKKIGILSPCSKRWGERKLFKKDKIKIFWFIHNHAYFLSVKLLEKLINKKSSYIDFFLMVIILEDMAWIPRLLQAYANNFLQQ